MPEQRAVLVTAGATRNPVDAMRYLSARSTGATGVWLATALARDTRVTLLGSAEALLRLGPPPPRVTAEEYGSTRDLMARMAAWVARHPDGVVVHAAAVGDYEAAPFDGKLPSGRGELMLRLTPTPKILDHLKQWSEALFVASFKAAPPGATGDRLCEIAESQRVRSRSDVVFANTIGRLGDDVLLASPTGCARFVSRAAGLDALLSTLRDAVLGPSLTPRRD